VATTVLVPFKTQKNGNRTEIIKDEVRELTMKDLGLTEADLEEFVRKNVAILFPEGEETLLVVGQQVRNREAGRADLVALDADGNVVLIELKRDRDDLVARKEAFEFQAIRYAANYALIRSPQDLVQKLFAPYIEKHRSEPEFQEELKGLTPSELAARRVDAFLRDNKASASFNQRQRIVLIASSFDPQTQSACAWLAKSGIDVRCIAISPVEYGQQYFFQAEQIIPPPALDDFFVEVAESSPSGSKRPAVSSVRSRKAMPRMKQILEWGLVTPGDVVHVFGHDSETAEIVDGDFVRYKGQQVGYNEWGQQVTGWSAINIYEWTVHEKTGETLDVLRRRKLEELEAQSVTGE
jgi:hypothetical protein